MSLNNTFLLLLAIYLMAAFSDGVNSTKIVENSENFLFKW